MQNPDQTATSYFKNGFNCAESVLKALAETIPSGVPHPESLATAFGGGIARQGEICGCLSGAAMAVGLAVGRTSGSDTESKRIVYEAVGRIFEQFKKQAGSINCKDISGLRFDTETHLTVCCPLVAFTVRCTAEEIAQLTRP